MVGGSISKEDAVDRVKWKCRTNKLVDPPPPSIVKDGEEGEYKLK